MTKNGQTKIHCNLSEELHLKNIFIHFRCNGQKLTVGLLFPDPTYLEDDQTIAKIGLHASSMLQVLILKKVFAAREVMLGLDFHY